MNAIILGGGIAGLTLAARLKNMGGYNITIYERNELTKAKGHAFLIHPAAAALIDSLPGIYKPLKSGATICEFNLFDTEKNQLLTESLPEWLCMRRTDLLVFLQDFLKDVPIVYNQHFSHFVGNNEKYHTAVFKSGLEVSGDIFFGCDGVHSTVRHELFGEVSFSPVHVKEIVSVVHSEKLAKEYAGKFTKYVHPTKSIAVGFIPCNSEELVWFMQFDASLQIEELDCSENIAKHAFRLASEFPTCITELLQTCSFEKSYVWHSTDFDLLPTFHKKNAVLLGDAAHVALPFTSAGVANALTDSGIVASFLKRYNNNIEEAFTQYYHTRAEELSNHIKQGRLLQEEFLCKNLNKNMVPLIQDLHSPNTI